MNSIEIAHINQQFGDDTEGKTMEDYFIGIQSHVTGTDISINNLKTNFKEFYSDETDWSF